MLRPSRRRALATVLFTDIVGSTARAEQLGDAAWRALLDSHHRAVRRLLRRHHGREVDTAGDGFFATFAQPADAIRCALEAADAVATLGIEIRAGIHTGEVEPMGAKVGGMAVHLGARILSVAEPGQIVVSGTVRDLVTGAGFTFRDLGTRPLKGIAEDWRLFEVERPAPAAAVPTIPVVARGFPVRRPFVVGGALVGLALVAALLAFVLVRGPSGPVEGATGGNFIRPIEADGSLEPGFRVGRGPAGMTFSNDALWVANTFGGTVSRVIPDEGEDAVVGAGVPTDLAAAGGLIWVLDPFASTVTILNPTEARVLQTIEAHGRAIAATADAVWLADDINDAVHRIDPRTRTLVVSIDLPAGSGPSALAATADAVWVVNALSGLLSRIDPRTNEVVIARLALASTPTSVAAGDGAVWVASEGADVVIQVDPDTNRVVGQQTACDRPTDLLVVGGDVVVACAGDRSVWRIRGTGGQPIITEVDGVPSGLASDGERVWVTVRES